MAKKGAEPMLQLYFKRAKCFVEPSNQDNGEKKFLASPGPNAQPVPMWVYHTRTFQQGIKDGSIVNLTPPQLLPDYKAPSEAAKVEDPKSKAEEAADEDEGDAEEGEDEEQKEAPKPAFGAQPNPAPKVGTVTSTTKKPAGSK